MSGRPSDVELRARLALGTVQFGLAYGVTNLSDKVPHDEVCEILRAGLNSGIRLLDTAVDYGDSENVLGTAGVSEWDVVSKLPALPDHVEDIRAWVGEQITGSLARLNITRLKGMLLHRPAQLLGPAGPALYAALRDEKEQGRISSAGISIYDPTELDALAGRFDFDIVQAPYNLFDRRISTSGWLNRLADLGVSVHTRSAYLQGLLLVDASDRPRWTHKYRAQFSAYDKWITVNHIDRAAACLGFCLNNPLIAEVIIGVQNFAQLQRAVDAATKEVPLAPDTLSCADIDLIDPRKWVHP